jgi:hypothetical protein
MHAKRPLARSRSLHLNLWVLAYRLKLFGAKALLITILLPKRVIEELESKGFEYS